MSDNVLMIITDQQMLDTLSCYGRGICRSPRLDELAKRGVRCDNHYTVTSLCTPARASVFTGRYPHEHGEILNSEFNESLLRGGDLADSQVTLFEAMKGAGYECWFHGKWHAGLRKLPEDYGAPGFSCPGYGNPHSDSRYLEYLRRESLDLPEIVREFYAEDGNLGDASGYLKGEVRATVEAYQTRMAIESLEACKSSATPFCGVLAYWGPHSTYLPAGEFVGMYDKADIPPWDNYADALEGRPASHAKYRDAVFKNAVEADWSTWQQILRRYFGFASMIDHLIGELLDKLDDLKLSESTWIVFTSDHGETAGVHGGWWDKGPVMYEETYRIPLILVPPRERKVKATTFSGLTSLVDLCPTILDIGGLDSSHLPGKSLKTIPDTCDDSTWREHLSAQFHGHRYLMSQRMLRWKQYKYVANAPDVNELYDLDEDPAEMHNLIDDGAHREVREEMSERLVEEMTVLGDTPGPQWQSFITH